MVFEKQYMLESKKQDLILIGLLHDLIEDTNFELDNLYHFDFPKRVIEGVDAMTRRVNESYQEYLVRCKQNPLARQVKIEDLKDNMSVERKYEPLAEWKSLMKRYEKSLAFMEKED
jgi:(p)ppGpp synthase/HD superfamily hydrolase